MSGILLTLALLSALAGAVHADGEGYMELVSATPIVYEGTPAWEYYYDVYSGGLGSATQIWLHGFDANDILNPLNQRWDSSAADGWGESQWGEFPSIGDGDPTGTDQWVLTGNTGAMINPIHSPSEYLVNEGMDWAFMYAGSVTAENDLHYWYGSTAQYIEGLYMTIRLVHPLGPGDISYSIYGPFYWDQQNVTITGPAVATFRLGDFDGDGDIDADDIDALGAAIQAGSTDLAFDMDGNGLVEQADFNLHVTTLVDTLIGEGSGTMFGDFNLDGVIDLIDLGTLGEQYGIGTGWATGDTDGNGVIDLIDLGSVGENYGFAATAPIPEPATMTLLGLGAVALIRRRRNT